MCKNDTALISWRDPLIAIALLTRLPLRLDENGFSRAPNAAWAYPLVGVIVGGLAGLVGLFAMWVGLPSVIAAMLVLGAMILLSGAMHEDGLADTVDGLWGGWDREARLKIMKDSHIGTYGVLALGVSLALRVAALNVIFSNGSVLLPMIAAATLSRAMMPAIMAALPHARTNGLSHSVGLVSIKTAMVAIIVAGFIAFFCLQEVTVPAFVMATVGAVCVALIARQKIGGQTGDILGATQQICEITVLLGILGATTI